MSFADTGRPGRCPGSGGRHPGIVRHPGRIRRQHIDGFRGGQFGKEHNRFLPELRKKGTGAPNKHLDFIEEAGAQGYILASGIKDIGRAVYDIAKGKFKRNRWMTIPLSSRPCAKLFEDDVQNLLRPFKIPCPSVSN